MTVIAYLVSDYHAASHTFVRREVAGLRALGETVLPFSIRGQTPSDEEPVPAIIGRSAWHHARAAAKLAFKYPGHLLSAWRRSLSHRPPGLRGLIWSQFHFVEAITLADMLHEAKAGHLHSHFANSGATVGLLAAQIAGIPWSVTLHGISETDYPAGHLLPEKLGAARFVAIASLFMQAQAMRVTEPEVWKKFHIVRCGIDLSRMPERAAPLPQHDLPRLVCVGRLSPEKGYFGLVDALSILAAEGRDYTLEIVGDGPARTEIASAFQATGLQERVTLAGALSESATLQRIASADILVLPSLMEGLPVVLMEAMAIGVPVVAARVAGIPELVEHGTTGLTYTPTDSSDLARNIALLLDDPDLRRRFVEGGTRKVAKEFTIEETAGRMRHLFREGGLQ